MFYVQSPHKEPFQLLDAINDFINFFPFGMISLTEQQWQSSKQGLISKFAEKDNNLNEKSSRFWSSIAINDIAFNKHSSIAKEVEKIERIDLIRFMVDLKSRTSDRIIMSSTEESNLNKQQLNGRYIEDIGEFQQASELFNC